MDFHTFPKKNIWSIFRDRSFWNSVIGEHLLQFLCQTVARQIVEQVQLNTIDKDIFSENRKRLEDELMDNPSSSTTRLPPPTFCRLALTRTLSDWPAVSSLIMNDKDLGGKCVFYPFSEVGSKKGLIVTCIKVKCTNLRFWNLTGKKF